MKVPLTKKQYYKIVDLLKSDKLNITREIEQIEKYNQGIKTAAENELMELDILISKLDEYQRYLI